RRRRLDDAVFVRLSSWTSEADGWALTNRRVYGLETVRTIRCIRVSGRPDLVALLCERPRQPPRHLTLREPHLGCDALLAPVAVVAEGDDPPLAGAEHVEGGENELAYLAHLCL